MMAENENGAVVGGAVTKDGEDWLLPNTIRSRPAASSFALNLKRRHLDPVTWGEMFMRYAEARGIRVGIQGRQDEKTDTVSVLATELGVNERTARRRLAAARLPEALREQVRSGERTVRTATQEVHRQERRRSYWQKCNRCTFS